MQRNYLCHTCTFMRPQVSCFSRLQKLPKVSPQQMSVQLIQLLEEATCNDDIHDVEIIVSNC